MRALLLVLFLIALFLGGTFLYSYRALKRQSQLEQAVDKRKLRRWEDDEDD